MSKRRLSRRQAWRINKIQEERAARAAKRDASALEELQSGQLGPEQHGQVVAHYGTQVVVEPLDQPDSHFRCHLRANLGSIVTGDKVVWHQGEPLGVIVARLDRDSELVRPDPYGKLKTVAANIDRIIIVIAPFPEPHANLIDRYLVASETQQIEPIILLNKVDRLDEGPHDQIEKMLNRYDSLGYQVVQASCRNSSRSI